MFALICGGQRCSQGGIRPRLGGRGGGGALLPKVDIKSAYYIIPVHLQDQYMAVRIEYSATIQTAFSPKDIFSGCRCHRVDTEKEGN